MIVDSEPFEKALAAALQLSVADRLRLIARIADSLADDLEISAQGRPVREIAWQGKITENHQLIVEMPEGFPPCTVTVVIEWPAGTKLNEISADQLKITIQLQDTEAIRLWFSDHQRQQGTSQ